VDFGPFKVCPLVGIVSDSRALNSSNYWSAPQTTNCWSKLETRPPSKFSKNGWLLWRLLVSCIVCAVSGVSNTHCSFLANFASESLYK
jgi:hypothetical protein